MDQQEAGAGQRGRPIGGAPGPCRQREARHEECGADVLHKVRVEGAGIGDARDAVPPQGTGKKHHEPVEAVEYRQNDCDPSLQEHLLGAQTSEEGAV
jgi:hypothetical protein